MAIVIYPLSYNSVQNQKNVFPFKNMQEQASRQKRQGKEPYRTKRARIREETGTLYVCIYICVCVYIPVGIYIYIRISKCGKKISGFIKRQPVRLPCRGKATCSSGLLMDRCFWHSKPTKCIHPVSKGIRIDQNVVYLVVYLVGLSKFLSTTGSHIQHLFKPPWKGSAHAPPPHRRVFAVFARLGPIQRSRSWRGHRNWRLENPPRVEDGDMVDYRGFNGDLMVI